MGQGSPCLALFLYGVGGTMADINLVSESQRVKKEQEEIALKSKKIVKKKLIVNGNKVALKSWCANGDTKQVFIAKKGKVDLKSLKHLEEI